MKSTRRTSADDRAAVAVADGADSIINIKKLGICNSFEKVKKKIKKKKILNKNNNHENKTKV